METLHSFRELLGKSYHFSATNLPNIQGVLTKETFRDVQSVPQTEQELSRWLHSKGRINWSKWR